MLHDNAGGRIEGFYALPRCVGISDVVIGELLALALGVIRQRARNRLRLAIERRLLVRVLPVAQPLGEVELQIKPAGEIFAFSSRRAERSQVVADRTVVGCGVRKGFLCKPKTHLRTDRTTRSSHLF